MQRQREWQVAEAVVSRRALATPTDLSSAAVRPSPKRSIHRSDAFALYTKTKNFHWYPSAQISATTTCCLTSRPRRSRIDRSAG